MKSPQKAGMLSICPRAYPERQPLEVVFAVGG